eukprot:303981_1
MALRLTSIMRKSVLVIVFALLNKIMKSLGFTVTTYGAGDYVCRGNEIKTSTLPAGQHEKRRRKRKQHLSEEKSKTRESSHSSRGKQQHEEHALATRNRVGKDTGKRRVDYYAVKSWKSRSSVTSQGSRRRGRMTGISWWLDEIRSSGMDTLGEFDVWWKNNSAPHDTIDKMQMWDDMQLKEALTERGLDNSGKREECERRLKDALLTYSMGDDGMRLATVDRGA